MRRRRWISPIVLALAFAVAGCDRANDSFIRNIEAAFDSDQSELALASVTDFDWDKVCIYGGYAVSARYDIGNTEGEWVFVFFLKGSVVSKRSGTTRAFSVWTPAAPGQVPCFGRETTAVLERIDQWRNAVRILRLTHAKVVPDEG